VMTALQSLGSAIGTLLDDTASKADKTAAEIKTVAAVTTIMAKMGDVVKGLRDSFAEKGAGGVVSDISKYFTQIGIALLQSGIPGLNVAGAVFLAIGVIGDVIGQLLTATNNYGSKALQAAQTEYDAQKR